MIRRFARRCMLAPMFAVACAGSTIATTASARSLFTGSATGTVIAINVNSFTIETVGRRTGVVNAMTAAANAITNRDYPYVYGGGHAQAGAASIGIRGSGHTGRRVGFDCSGSVAAVLTSAGLWPAGGGVPNDAGIIAMLRSERLIAPGVGRGPVEVTLYDDPGVHIFMNIDGRFFGTSDGGGGGDARGGAGWLADGAPDATSSVYKPYHFRPSALRADTSTGHILSFEAGMAQREAGPALGDKVQIGYDEAASGALIATSIGFPGATTASGTIAAIAPDGSSFTVQTTSGTSATFTTSGDQMLLQGLAVGDTVEITYTTNGAALLARAVTVAGAPTGNVRQGGGWPGGD